MRLAFTWVALTIASVTAAASGADDAGIVGVWLTAPGHPDGQARIEIVEEGDVYRGRIVWLEQPRYPEDDPKGMGGKTRVDRENPDPTLRDRPVIGLVIVDDLRFDGDGAWNGRIYDADRGRVFRCRLRLGDDDGTLEVRGFVGVPLLGGSTTWTRVTSPGSR